MKQVNRIVIFLFLLTSCSNGIENDLYVLVEKQFRIDNCNVKFSNIIKEDWDSFYIVSEFIIPIEITDEIGIEYTGEMVKEDEYRIIFIYKNKIIKEESFFISRIIIENEFNSGITKVSRNDSFCCEFVDVLEPSYYVLKKQ